MDLITSANIKIYVFFVLLFLNKCVSCARIYSIESDKVCSLLHKRHIHLGRQNDSVAIVKETRYFDTWLGDFEFKCKFKVETQGLGNPTFPIHSDEGVLAVIQNLTLRQDAITGECIDYIQFKFDNGRKSRQYCGEMSTSVPEIDLIDAKGFAANSFVDPHGRLNVVIYIANQKLKPLEKIDFTIAFTAYKGCYSRSEYYEICPGMPTIIDEGDSFANHLCIWRHLFNDGIVNCPYIGCVDEIGCRQHRSIVRHGNGTAVTVGALATVILIFLCFLASLWVLRKLHMICWSAPVSNARLAPAVEFSQFAPGQVNAPSPAAGIEPDTPDKDPPPAYDSLFPPRPSAPAVNS